MFGVQITINGVEVAKTKIIYRYGTYLSKLAQNIIYRVNFKGYGIVSCRVVDPDSMVLWIRAHIRNPDPGFGSRMKKKMHFCVSVHFSSYI
jgi:hypothetical protein